MRVQPRPPSAASAAPPCHIAWAMLAVCFGHEVEGPAGRRRRPDSVGMCGRPDPPSPMHTFTIPH